MKNLIIILIVTLMASSAVAQNSQLCSTCLPEGITFTTQAQIDSFQINYPGCAEIQGDVEIGVWPMTNISNLDSLDVITYVAGDLFIHCTILTDLMGLNNLDSIGGSFIVGWNHLITDFTGLTNLVSIGGDFQVGYMDGALTRGNNLLVNFNGLQNLQIIQGALGIHGNESLSDLWGLGSLISIGDHLGISNNNNQNSLIGLHALTFIGGALYIGPNTAINNMSGLENLSTLIGNLELNWANLSDFTGLINVNSIGGELHLNSAKLKSMNGLQSVNSVGSNIEIRSCNSLKTLNGLENINSIGGDLIICCNDSLETISGLDNVEAGSIENLEITFNDYLNDCAIQSICDYLAAPNGELEIHDNATDCNSPEEVDSACVYLSMDDANHFPVFLIYPNPSSTQITIALTNTSTPQKNMIITIYNISGQQLLKRQTIKQINVVDVAGLNVGIYFVKLLSDDGVIVWKFVKQ